MRLQFDPVLIITTLFLFGLFMLLIIGGFVFVLNRFKSKGREEDSIDSVLLQIAVPKNNEVKIDAMDQFFSALYSIKQGGWKQKYKKQASISFEMVAKKEDIRFYIWTPKEFQDLVEKQVHGVYPDADVQEVTEYNLFTENGKVAYKSLQLKKENYYPLKTFRDLPTDPLSLLTSALAKMGDNEAAALQVLVSPAESSWQSAGYSFISSTKKQESDPEKAKYSVGAKTLEAIENKIAKPGFETSNRFV